MAPKKMEAAGNEATVDANLPQAPFNTLQLDHPLIEMIVSKTPFSDLKSLSATSHQLYSICQPRLRKVLSMYFPWGWDYREDEDSNTRVQRCELIHRVLKGKGTPFEESVIGLNRVKRLEMALETEEGVEPVTMRVHDGLDLYLVALDVFQALTNQLEYLSIRAVVDSDLYPDIPLGPLTLPKLQHLDWGTEEEDGRQLHALRLLLIAAPTIVSLQVSQRCTYRSIMAICEDTASVPRLPHLKEIHWLRMNDPNDHFDLWVDFEFLDEIIGSAPALETIKGFEIQELPSRKVVELKKLKTLEWTEWYRILALEWDEYYEQGDLPGLKYHKMGLSPTLGYYIDCESGCLRHLAGSPYPAVEHVVVVAHRPIFRLSETPPGATLHLLSRWLSIGSEVLTLLENSPELRIVETRFNQQEHSDDWERDKRTGCIIRTYESDSHLLTHVKVGPQQYNQEIVVAKGETRFERTKELVWIEATDYDGKMVPPEILSEVYKTAGLDQNWKEGGRGLELPAASWEVLSAWFDSLSGPKEEEVPILQL